MKQRFSRLLVFSVPICPLLIHEITLGVNVSCQYVVWHLQISAIRAHQEQHNS